MARAKASTLAVKKKRLEFPVARKPHFESLGDGLSLGYRRNQAAGTWVARKSDGKGGSSQRVIGIADDYQEADGSTVLTWGQAQAKAFAIVAMNPRSRLTIREVIDGYSVELAIRGGDPGNVARLRHRVPLPLMDRMVDDLRGGELREWRDGLLKDGLRPATVNRTCNALRAALNRAADQRKEVVNRHVWQRDLVALPDASFARNVILSDHVVRSLVASAYVVGEALGLLVETTAVTGARYSQLGRLQVKDLQDDLTSPRLMMPSSRKGKAVRRVVHRPVPIPVSLAARLRVAAQGRHGYGAPARQRRRGALEKIRSHPAFRPGSEHGEL